MRVLILSTGSFSGTTASLARALEAAGNNVRIERPSLRQLRLWPLYFFAAVIESFCRYGRRAWKQMRKTRVGFYAYSRAAKVTVAKSAPSDLVIQIGANGSNILSRNHPQFKTAIFADHTNMISKKLPDYGFDAPERHVKDWWNRLEGCTLRAQDHVFVMGEHVKHSMVESYAVPQERITVVGGGPNLDVDIERDGVVKDFKARDILFVGLDGPRKGLDTLLLAFAQVRKVYPEARLHVVGVEGESSAGITFYGKRSGQELVDLFYQCPIFAMPTRREPFGIVYVEAMWAKGVCIASNIEAIPQIVLDGRTGYLVEPGDFRAIAERIIALFKNPKTLEQLGEEAYRVARRTWSWHHVVTRMTDGLEGAARANARLRAVGS